MKLTDETLAGINLVRAHAPGEIRVGETVIRHSCLLRADRLDQWRPPTLDAMTMDDLDPIFEMQPEILVLGTGTRQRFPDAEWMGAVLARGIGCEVMTTAAACRTYNVLVSEDRVVVAALLLQDD